MNSAGDSKCLIETESASPAATLPFANKSCTRRASLTRLMQHESYLPDQIIKALWRDPDRLINEGQMLKDGDRCTVVKVTCSNSHQTHEYVLKRFNLRGPIHTCLHFGLKTRAHNCWQSGRQLIDLGIRTPRPLAFLEHRIGPLKTKSYVITDYVDGAPLQDFLSARCDSPATALTLAIEFAEIWHQFTDHQITHGDMKATNFLVTRDRRIFVIDLDAMQHRRAKSRFQKHHQKDWDRFMKNWRQYPVIAQAFIRAVQSHDSRDQSARYRESA